MKFQPGSLMNQLMGPGVKPEVGMGATELCYTDRHAFTIIAVSASGKTITVQRDNATRADSHGMSDCQSYTYSADPNGAIYELRLTKKGYAHKGTPFTIGCRREHYDYSF